MNIHYPLNIQGAEDPTLLPWTNGVPATGVEGSYPPWQACIYPMQEIVAIITAAGLTPTDADLTQLYEAVEALIARGVAGGVATAEAAATNIFNATANPKNTRRSSATTGGLSLQTGAQAIAACGQATTVLWNTVVIPAGLGTYNAQTGLFTATKAGWFSVEANVSISANSGHAVDVAKFSADVVSMSGGTQGTNPVTGDATFPPPGALNAGFANASFAAGRDFLLAVGDTLELQVGCTTLYNDATEIQILDITNMTIAYLNPDS